MKFSKTRLAGAMVIDLDRHSDSRGYFARVFCTREFAEAGLVTDFVQGNHSHNIQAGTLRGMHFQRAPHGEVKVVRVVRGAIHDVFIDLRRDSPTFGQWEAVELSAENGRMLYLPKGFAHGFQTLVDDSDVVYQLSHPYTPGAESGVRWNDPAFGIAWPLPVSAISEKDAAWPDVDLSGQIPI